MSAPDYESEKTGRDGHEPESADPRRAQLVAYLDGELDPDAASELESQFAIDPELREIKNRMEVAWGLLDHLPRAELDEAFTHSTMEMVALKGGKEEVRIEQNLLSRQRRRRVLFGAGGVLAVGLAGFLVVNRIWPDPNEQVLQDLPVLLNLEQYRQVDEVEFLRLLKEENLFPEDPSNGG